MSPRPRILALAALAALALPARARAEDRESVLDAPAPPTLPALAHRDLTYTFEYTAAIIEPNAAAGAEADNAYAWSAHGELEVPLEPRKWYLGVAHDVASAAIPGVGSRILVGNPEIWGRGLWSSVQGLSAGGSLGLVLPVPRQLSAEEQEVLSVVRTVRPWDVAYFDDLTVTFRPSFDIRHVVGRLTIQLRQGIDWSLRGEGGGVGYDMTGRATLYAGYRAHPAIGVGLELWEVYQITHDLPDDRRAATAISPSIRFILPRVSPALSFLFPIATPLRGDVESYYAMRLNVGFEIELPRARPAR